MTSDSLEAWLLDQIRRYPLTSALLGRRSRRFAPGMTIPSGPFRHESTAGPRPLTETDEAALVFAAAGLSGYALADLSYGPGEGGTMLGGMAGRVVASADSLDSVSLFVVNDEATYFIRRPQNLSLEERDEIVALARDRQLVEIYRRLRVKIADGRTSIPVTPGINFNINRWAVYAPGTTYLLPVTELTAVHINALLEAFEPEMGLTLVDERNWFLPAGVRPWIRSRGGHLWDDPRDGRVVTIQGLESSLVEATGVEVGGMLHSLGLMSQALGLGGYCNYARNEYHWMQALGFEMQTMSSARYAGAGWLPSLGARMLGKVFPFPYATGLKHDGEALLTAYCPPNYPDMEAAVRALVEDQYGPEGVWKGRSRGTSWSDPTGVAAGVHGPSAEAVDATIAYCTYVYERYGRFPAYPAPFRTSIAYQANTVDREFYQRFYRSDALTDTQLDRPESPTT